MDKYKYSYEWTPNYCYKDSDVLINKLNITNDKELFIQERNFVSLRTYELIENPIKGNFDFNHLKCIHKYLFQDVYRWAGDVRNCSISKKDLFCLPEYIQNYADEIFAKLESNNYFITCDYEDKIKKLVELFSDINALHPFREGNGRTQREFIENLASINGIELDLTTVSQKAMIIASHESVNGEYKKLYKMFKNNSKQLSKETQRQNINKYVNDKKLVTKLLKLI